MFVLIWFILGSGNSSVMNARGHHRTCEINAVTVTLQYAARRKLSKLIRVAQVLIGNLGE